MRTIPAPLLTELESGSPRIARLIKLTCEDGTIIAVTDHDKSLVVDGTTHVPAPGLETPKLISTGNAEVSTQNLRNAFAIEVPDSDLEAGKFDNATVEVAWCSWADPSAGKVVTFSGKIGDIKWSEEGFEVELVSYMRALERNLGQTYTASCRHELYGSGGPGFVGKCGVDPTTFTKTGTVTSIAVSKWRFSCSGAASTQADDYFAFGVLTWTTGNNAGLSCTVKKNTGAALDLVLPTAFAIQVGDTFSVKAGCDKTLETCRTKFNNVANFGGFPHINTDVTFR